MLSRYFSSSEEHYRKGGISWKRHFFSLDRGAVNLAGAITRCKIAG